MTEDFLYWLDQISPSHRSWVGDKAFYLGMLAQRGYAQPPGFVISASVFQEFLAQIQWADPLFADLPNSSLHIDVDNPRQLRMVAQQLRQAIQATPLPTTWLAQIEQSIQPWRSSAVILRPSIALPMVSDPTVSFRTTGLLTAEACWAEPDAIAHSLRRVWASLFQAKSLLYWQRLGIQLQQIHLAILVQPLQSVIASGDAQLQEQQLEIRATWGLGKALVNGEIIPDRIQISLSTSKQSQQLGSKSYAYRIPAATDTIAPLPIQTCSCYEIYPLNPTQQSQPVLNADQIQQIAALVQQVANEVGALITLEWIYAEAPPDQPTLQITQVILQLSSRSQLALNPSNETDSLELRTSLPPVPVETTLTPSADLLSGSSFDRGLQPNSPTPDSASATRAAPSESSPNSPFSNAPPLLTGLAASPGQVTAVAWVMPSVLPPATEMPARVIFVASSITPDVLPLIKQVVGIVTEQGGMTSHGAILARELGIPAVTGVRNATQYIRSGERLWLDGNQGEVQRIGLHRSGTEVQPQRIDAQRTDSHDSQPAAFQPAAAPSPLINPPIATQLFVTLSQPDAIARVAHLPVDGVGLVRSELMLLEVLEQRHPQIWIEQGQQAELVDRIARQMHRFVEAFFPRPVYYRSADWRSHEFSYLQGMITVAEPNPMLGLRGTLSYQYHPAWFEVELAALRHIQQNGYSNLHLILPFVRTVEEFRFCRQQVERMGLFQQPQFQLWIMAEVPSVLLLLPDYIAAGVQGIAIGSNDLTQLLLGIDRDQPALANVFNANHPAVIRAIHQLIHMARTAQIPCSICGLAAKPSLDLINLLVQWGITAISVEPGEVEQTYGAIVRAERQLLIAAARQWAGSDE